MFPLKPVPPFVVIRRCLGQRKKCPRSVRETCALSIHQTQLSVQSQLTYGNSYQFAARQFTLHADFRDKSYTIPHDEEALDSLQCGQLNVHVQWSLVTAKCLDHFLAIRRRNDMGNKRLRAQLTDADLIRRSQRMTGRNHERQLVQVDDDRTQLRLLRVVGEQT